MADNKDDSKEIGDGPEGAMKESPSGYEVYSGICAQSAKLIRWLVFGIAIVAGCNAIIVLTENAGNYRFAARRNRADAAFCEKYNIRLGLFSAAKPMS